MPRPGDSAPERPRVIVVDDTEDTRDLYATYFDHAGFDVETAADGEEALASIARRKPAAVVMDLSMPMMDGWEATRLIKSNPQTRDVIVLVVTGHALADDISRARAVGANDVFTKPCLPHVLVEKLNELLRRS